MISPSSSYIIHIAMHLHKPMYTYMIVQFVVYVYGYKVYENGYLYYEIYLIYWLYI